MTGEGLDNRGEKEKKVDGHTHTDSTVVPAGVGRGGGGGGRYQGDEWWWTET